MQWECFIETEYWRLGYLVLYRYSICMYLMHFCFEIYRSTVYWLFENVSMSSISSTERPNSYKKRAEYFAKIEVCTWNTANIESGKESKLVLGYCSNFSNLKNMIVLWKKCSPRIVSFVLLWKICENCFGYGLRWKNGSLILSVVFHTVKKLYRGLNSVLSNRYIILKWICSHEFFHVILSSIIRQVHYSDYATVPSDYFDYFSPFFY